MKTQRVSKPIQEICDILLEEYKPDRIILFGSWARGDAGPASDIDILVISDQEAALPRYKRGLDVRVKLAHIRIPKDILFYTNADVAKWRNVRNSFVHKVLEEGTVLYDKR